jgi:hypothetical protein
MSAIERYYSKLSPMGPWCAEDEDDTTPMSEEEIAIAYEVAMQDF